MITSEYTQVSIASFVKKIKNNVPTWLKVRYLPFQLRDLKFGTTVTRMIDVLSPILADDSLNKIVRQCIFPMYVFLFNGFLSSSFLVFLY
jgi:hypothetical protein